MKLENMYVVVDENNKPDVDTIAYSELTSRVLYYSKAGVRLKLVKNKRVVPVSITFDFKL